MVTTSRIYQFSSIFVLISIVSLSYGKIPSTILCGDSECKTIISMAKTSIRYGAGDTHMVSFPANKDVRVLAKSENGELWKIEVQGRSGYASARHLQESKVLVHSSKLIKVSTVPVVTETPEKPVDVAVEEVVVVKEVVTPPESPTTETVEPIKSEEVVVLDEPAKIEEVGVKIVDNEPNKVEEVFAPAIPDENISEPTTENENASVETDGEASDETYEDASVETEMKDILAAEPVDEEEQLELEYAGKKPVDEPLFVQKHVYQVGDSAASPPKDLDKEVKLEVVGLESNTTEKSNTKMQTESIENVKVESATAEEVNLLEKNPKEKILPTTTLPTEPDTKNNSADIIEPTETVSVPSEVTEVPKPNLAKPNVVEYDGTTFDLENLEDYMEATTAKTPDILVSENVEITTTQLSSDDVVPSVVDSSTPLETKSVDIDNKNVFEDSKFFEQNNEAIHLNHSPSKNVEQEKNVISSTGEVQIPSSIVEPEILTTVNSTDLPQANENVDFVATETTEANQDVVVANATTSNFVPVENSSDPSHNSNIVIDNNLTTEIPNLNLVREKPQLSEDFNENIESEPFIPPVVEQHQEPQEIQQQEEIEQQEPAHEHEQTTEPTVETTTAGSPNTDDIFSSNFVTESSNEDVVQSDGSWYDGIIISFEEIVAKVQNLINSKSSNETTQKDDSESQHSEQTAAIVADGYCEKLEEGSCPKDVPKSVPCHNIDCISNLKHIDYDKFAGEFLAKLVAASDLVFLLTFTGFCVLLFTLGHYWLTNKTIERTLLSKLNNAERNLLKTEKECSVVKADLVETRRKLTSIADKSFGTDDMIKQCESEKVELREQIASLEKELETAAEAGLELNKMVSELLSNQSGSDSIISSVEELQQQLNEQEAATVYINNLLAEKSRENSELQVLLAETNNKFGAEIDELLKQTEDLKAQKESLETELKETLETLETELNKELTDKSNEITRLAIENSEITKKYEEITSRWHISSARAEALEDSIRKIKELNGKDIKAAIEITDSNAKLLAAQKEVETLRDQLENEVDNKRRLEEQINIVNEQITKIRAEFNQNEKDKLEAQTRLDVLSSYFKEKEAQLQKELSVKEALFMKQQGESTSTVERIRGLQEEIQGLRSQNDELRAEIEAQSAAHKAQINAAESRAHDSWLAAKQAERRLEEARAEASVLRKKLTSLSFNAVAVENNLVNQPHPLDGMMPLDLNAPSPIHMDPTPGSPLMNLPLPPFMPPPPLIGNAPAFMPPPPLLPIPTGEMRPAPLGRLMSPPPPNNFVDDRRYGRYSPDSRYDDYPTDIYETETDFSPPRSPEPYRRNDRNYRDYSPSPPPAHKTKKKSSFSKGTLSSGSVESSSSQKVHRGGKVYP